MGTTIDPCITAGRAHRDKRERESTYAHACRDPSGQSGCIVLMRRLKWLERMVVTTLRLALRLALRRCGSLRPRRLVLLLKAGLEGGQLALGHVEAIVEAVYPYGVRVRLLRMETSTC